MFAVQKFCSLMKGLVPSKMPKRPLCNKICQKKKNLSVYQLACLTATCPSYKNLNIELQPFANADSSFCTLVQAS